MEISYDISYNKDCNFANSAVTLVLNSINFNINVYACIVGHK
jgi:hypothetical protein